MIHAGMAITAIDPKAGHVMLVTEGNRLVLRYTNLRLPRGIIEPIKTEQSSNQ